MSSSARQPAVAVLSGGAGGIGTACALRLREQGAVVALVDRDADALDAAVMRLGGDGVLTLPTDVADQRALGAAFDRIQTELGPVSIAVSAVAHEEHGSWETVEPPQLERSLRITVAGGYSFCKLAATQMSAGGRIAIVSSLHATLPFAGAIAYNAAQAALRQLGLSLARELISRRIAVNLVEPGWIDTPGERRWYTDEQLAVVGGKLPWGRLGTPEDVAAVVAFVCSPDAAYVTGATVRVDGGLALTMPRLPEVEE